jgi:tRNA pseudouridine38-40 synthase
LDHNDLSSLQKNDLGSVLMRIKLTISYNGAAFHGSQIQPDRVTVNGSIQNALRNLNIDGKVHAAGRTDRGVHATNQVLHVDIPPFWHDTTKLKNILNQQLNNDILIKRIEHVQDDFHSRYSAKSRIYRYVMKDKKFLNPFEHPFVTYVDEIDLHSLNQNMRHFLGSHDFQYFAKYDDEMDSTIRTISKAFAYRHKEMTVLHFQANGFLRSQIRMMTAMLLAIESQKATTDDLIRTLECKQRFMLKPAPPNSLYLAKILY